MGRSSFALFVARRYLFSRRKQTFISVISLMSILGVALGVGALVVVLGVYNGLTTDMRDKILGANAHGIVMSYQPAAFQCMPVLRERTLKVPHVTGATPFIYTECMVSANGSVKGIVLRGVDPATAPEVVSMLARLRQGAVGDLVREGLPSTTPRRRAKRARPATSPTSGPSWWWAPSRPACSNTIPRWPSWRWTWPATCWACRTAT